MGLVGTPTVQSTSLAKVANTFSRETAELHASGMGPGGPHGRLVHNLRSETLEPEDRVWIPSCSSLGRRRFPSDWILLVSVSSSQHGMMLDTSDAVTVKQA